MLTKLQDNCGTQFSSLGNLNRSPPKFKSWLKNWLLLTRLPFCSMGSESFIYTQSAPHPLVCWLFTERQGTWKSWLAEHTHLFCPDCELLSPAQIWLLGGLRALCHPVPQVVGLSYWVPWLSENPCFISSRLWICLLATVWVLGGKIALS